MGVWEEPAIGKKLFLAILSSSGKEKGQRLKVYSGPNRSKNLKRLALEKECCWEHPERRPKAGTG